jgi:hypothetical protein
MKTEDHEEGFSLMKIVCHCHKLPGVFVSELAVKAGYSGQVVRERPLRTGCY